MDDSYFLFFYFSTFFYDIPLFSLEAIFLYFTFIHYKYRRGLELPRSVSLA